MLRECFALSGVMHINHQCDWLGRQLFQFHGQCHISLPYKLRERFNGNESWSLSEFNASQVWTWGSRMWNVVTLPGLTNSSAVNAHWPIDINLLLWSLSIALPVENVLEHQHTKWHMLINIHAGRNAGDDITLAMWQQVERTARMAMKEFIEVLHGQNKLISLLLQCLVTNAKAWKNNNLYVHLYVKIKKIKLKIVC